MKLAGFAAIALIFAPVRETLDSEPIHVLSGHDKAVLAVAFSRDGTRIATGSESGLTRIWDAKTGEPVLDLEFQYAVNGLAFTRDGKTLVTGTWGAQVWNLEEGLRKNHLEAHTGFLTCVETSPDGKLVATGGLDSTVKHWEPANWQEQRSLPHRDQVNAMSFSGDGKLLAVAGDTSVALWSTNDWKLVRELKNLPASALVLDSDAKRLYVGGQDGVLKVHHVQDGSELAKITAHKSKITGVSLSTDGKLVATAGQDEIAKLYSAEDVKEKAAWKHPAALTCIRFSPDGKSLITGGKDGHARVWKVP